jgi:hypothetical protein
MALICMNIILKGRHGHRIRGQAHGHRIRGREGDREGDGVKL